LVGDGVGCGVGSAVGVPEGCGLGTVVGSGVGANDGVGDGTGVGSAVGSQKRMPITHRPLTEMGPESERILLVPTPGKPGIHRAMTTKIIIRDNMVQ
jgi:hypothetical protein